MPGDSSIRLSFTLVWYKFVSLAFGVFCKTLTKDETHQTSIKLPILSHQNTELIPLRNQFEAHHVLARRRGGGAVDSGGGGRSGGVSDMPGPAAVRGCAVGAHGDALQGRDRLGAAEEDGEAGNAERRLCARRRGRHRSGTSIF